MLSCCTVKCYGDAFELICFEFNFFFFLRNNGTAMAVLAAPLPAALRRLEFSRHMIVRISWNFSGFVYPPLALDVANLSLDVVMQFLVFSFPDVTMTVVLPIYVKC